MLFFSLEIGTGDGVKQCQGPHSCTALIPAASRLRCGMASNSLVYMHPPFLWLLPYDCCHLPPTIATDGRSMPQLPSFLTGDLGVGAVHGEVNMCFMMVQRRVRLQPSHCSAGSHIEHWAGNLTETSHPPSSRYWVPSNAEVAILLEASIHQGLGQQINEKDTLPFPTQMRPHVLIYPWNLQIM